MPERDNIRVEAYDSLDERHIKFANDLEDIRRQEHPVMLPLGAEVIANHKFGVIAGTEDEVVGYNGILFEYPNGLVEMGGLIVSPDFRHRGMVNRLKAPLFDMIREHEGVKNIITFANGSSEQINRKLGFRDAAPDEIPQEGIANCAQCPKVECARTAGKICCDTILIIGIGDLPYIEAPSGSVKV